MKRYIRSSRYSDAKLAETTSDSSILRELALSDEGSVRFRVALNLHTPEDVLISLLQDPDKNVRNGVAGNEALPESEMRRIADLPLTTRTYKMKINLIDNIGCPVELLEKLAQDKDEDVAHYAERRLNAGGMSAWYRDSAGILRYRGYS